MGLTETEKKELKKIKQAIEKKFPGEVQRMLVFGSKARGTATEDSDLDLLMVVSTKDADVHSRMRYLVYDFDEDFSLNISAHVMTAAHFAHINKKRYSFARSIEQHHELV